MKLTLLALALVAAGLYAPVSLADCPTTDPTSSNSKAGASAKTVCNNPNFAVNYPLGECPNIGTQSEACLTPPQAPAPASMWCEPTGSGFFCEAWPQSAWDEDLLLRYTWTTTGALQPVWTSETSPMGGASCWTTGNGSLTVTVRTPYEVIATSTKSMKCTIGHL